MPALLLTGEYDLSATPAMTGFGQIVKAQHCQVMKGWGISQCLRITRLSAPICAGAGQDCRRLGLFVDKRPHALKHFAWRAAGSMAEPADRVRAGYQGVQNHLFLASFSLPPTATPGHGIAAVFHQLGNGGDARFHEAVSMKITVATHGVHIGQHRSRYAEIGIHNVNIDTPCDATNLVIMQPR